MAADNWDTTIFYGKGTERLGSTRQNAAIIQRYVLKNIKMELLAALLLAA